MNAFLAEMYNTRQNIGAESQDGVAADIEKVAEAQLLEDMFTAENVDVNTLDPMTILKVASALFGEDSALVKSAEETVEEEAKREGEPVAQEKKEKASAGDGEVPPQFKKEEKKSEEKKEEEKEESMEDKVAEADFLGRVMAHSYIDELSNLEKSAALEQVKQAKLEKIAAQQPAAEVAQPVQTTGSAVLDKLAGLTPAREEPQIDQQKAAFALQLLKEAGVELPFDYEAEKFAAPGMGILGRMGKGIGSAVGLATPKGLKGAALTKHYRQLGGTAATVGGVGLGVGALGGRASAV